VSDQAGRWQSLADWHNYPLPSSSRAKESSGMHRHDNVFLLILLIKRLRVITAVEALSLSASLTSPS
jgi:hypothetical protein